MLDSYPWQNQGTYLICAGRACVFQIHGKLPENWQNHVFWHW